MIGIHFFRRLLLSPIAAVIFAFMLLWHQGASAGENGVIKLATVIPERTAWVIKLQEIFKDVHKQTGGRLKFVIYAGGIAGDEMDIIRKMRAKQIHVGFLTGVGLSTIVSRVRIFETPGLFRNYDEVDYLKDDLFPSFYQDFRKAGYELLAFVDGGPIYLFSKQDLTQTDKFDQIKMWAYKGDQSQMDFIRDLGMSPVPLHIADVNVGLEMNMVDSFYGPAPVVNAFQWCLRAKYMLDFPVSNAITAIIVSRRFFDNLDAETRKLITDAFHKGALDMVRQVREDNATSIEIIRGKNIHVLVPDEAQQRFYHERFRINIEHIIENGIYSGKQYQDVLKKLEEFRKSRDGKGL